MVLIAEALQAANSYIRKEAQRDKEKYEGRVRIHSWERNIRYFDENDLAILDEVQRSRLPPSGGIPELSQELENVSYLPIWRKAIDSLHEFQGQHYGSVSWRLAKQRALDILQQRDIAAERFQAVQDDLTSRASDDLCNAIIRKIRMLERFTMIYDAQPVPSTMEDIPDHEPYYELFPLENRGKEKNIVQAYPQAHQQVSCLIA